MADCILNVEDINVYYGAIHAIKDVSFRVFDGEIVALIKPQFEAGREKVGKKGVVRDKRTHMEVIAMVIQYALSIGFSILNLEFSPIKGPEGNIEYLIHLEKCGEDARIAEGIEEEKTVEEAFCTLAKN